MSGPPLPFPPPIRLPIGYVRDGQVFMDERFWIDFMRMLYEKTQTVPGTTIQDLSDVALTAAQKTDLTDGGDSALHFHQSDRDYADAAISTHVVDAGDPHAAAGYLQTSDLPTNPVLLLLMAGA